MTYHWSKFGDSLYDPASIPQSGKVQSSSDYQQMLAILPKIDLSRRERLLAAVWDANQNEIKRCVPEASNLNDWSQASEETRNAIQNYLQHQNSGFFISDYNDYTNAIDGEWNLINGFNGTINDTDLNNFLQLSKRISIRCAGCALTVDLIMSIMSQVCTRLADNHNDISARDAIRKLNGIKKFLGNDSLYAHEIPNLPEIATSVESTIRVLASNLRSELTGPELGQLAKLVSQSDLNIFVKPRLISLIEKIRAENPKGIFLDEFKARLYQDPKINANREKLDELIDKAALKSPTTQTLAAFGAHTAK